MTHTPKQHIDWIKYLIAAEDFPVKAFLLTAPRVRPPARERRRRQILQLMHRCGLSAHDLVETNAPPPPSQAQAVGDSTRAG